MKNNSYAVACQQYTQHINRLLSELTTTGKEIRLTEHCRQHTVDRGDMHTYFVMYR